MNLASKFENRSEYLDNFCVFSRQTSYIWIPVAEPTSEVLTPGGGVAVTQHMHIRGRKSDIFGSKHCQKRHCLVQIQLKPCS